MIFNRRNIGFYRLSILFLTIVLPLLIASCSGTKHLAENEVLYVGSRLKVRKNKQNKFKIKDGNKKLMDAYLTVWDLPNGSVLATPFIRFIPTQLIVYNWFYNEKNKGFKHWMRENFGEPPVLLSKVNPDIKVQKIVESYENYGHFKTKAHYKLKLRRKGKKAFVKYFVEIAPSYSYRKVWYENDSLSGRDSINFAINEFMKTSKLQAEEEFNLYTLQEERKNLWNYLQNRGYYYLFENDIIFEADTTVGNRKIDLRLRLNNSLTSTQTNKVTVESISYTIDSITKDLYQIDKFNYKNGFLKGYFLDSITTIDTTTFSLENSLQTSNFLSFTGIFQKQQIRYDVNPSDSSKIKANIFLTPSKATRFTFGVNGDFQASGYLGPSVKAKISQLNLFGKAQNLDLTTNIFYYFPIGLFNNRNTNVFGTSIQLQYSAPAISTKINWPKTKTRLPMYFYKTNFDFLRRENFYTQVTLNGAYGVNFSTLPNDRHQLSFIDLTVSDIHNTTQRYDSILANNLALKQSLQNQFILSAVYSYTIDKRKNKNWPTGLYFEAKVESSGNVLNLINSIFTNQPTGNKKAFGVRFAQFTQFNLDFRYFLKINPVQTLAFKTSGGIGIPYGNSKTMPYIKQYFIGGTNSLRPFSAKVVGPGRYVEFDPDAINQMGDLKLEMNLEYRFKLGVRLSGAVWADGGNIWLMKEDVNRPGSGVRWNKLFKDSYLTAGVGLRLDLNFIILRYDYGLILYAPFFNDGYQWVFQNKIFLHGSTIGIGFPF